MKNINYFFILVIFTFLFSACEENGIFFPTNTTTQSKGLFEVKVNGNVFSTENVNFISDGVDLYINAIKPETNEIFTLKVDDFDIGNFSFEGVNTVASYIKNNALSADIWSTINETSSRGSIEFTNIDFVNNRVSGTFNFIGKNVSTGSSSAFTNGTFTNIPKSDLLITDDIFTAKIDGVEYVEISLFGNLVNVGSGNLIMISANKSLTETIGIRIPSNISVGEYDFGAFSSQTDPTAQYIFDGTTYVADGKIVITKHEKISKLISGTFQFNASPITTNTPNYSITEGEFSISY